MEKFFWRGNRHSKSCEFSHTHPVLCDWQQNSNNSGIPKFSSLANKIEKKGQLHYVILEYRSKLCDTGIYLPGRVMCCVRYALGFFTSKPSSTTIIHLCFLHIAERKESAQHTCTNGFRFRRLIKRWCFFWAVFSFPFYIPLCRTWT